MNLFTAIQTTNLTFENYLIITVAAFMCGAIAAVASSYKNEPSRSFVASLVVLPVIVETIILMVNGNVGTGIAISGAFSLVRFRSVQGRAKEMVSIFMVMTCGVACAVGYIGVALLLAIIISLAMIVTMSIPLKEDKMMQLNITVPESLNFDSVFDEILKKYTDRKSTRLNSSHT